MRCCVKGSRRSIKIVNNKIGTEDSEHNFKQYIMTEELLKLVLKTSDANKPESGVKRV